MSAFSRFVLTLASHGHCNVNIYPQLTVSKEQMQFGNILSKDTGLKCSNHSSYLLKSLSTSYSYFIHVSLYTKNSRKARTAMRVNAIRDTEESIKMSHFTFKVTLSGRSNVMHVVTEGYIWLCSICS